MIIQTGNTYTKKPFADHKWSNKSTKASTSVLMCPLTNTKKKMMIESKLLSIYVVGQPLNRWVKKISPISDPSTFFVIKTSKGIDKTHRNSKVM